MKYIDVLCMLSMLGLPTVHRSSLVVVGVCMIMGHAPSPDRGHTCWQHSPILMRTHWLRVSPSLRPQWHGAHEDPPPAAGVSCWCLHGAHRAASYQVAQGQEKHRRRACNRYKGWKLVTNWNRGFIWWKRQWIIKKFCCIFEFLNFLICIKKLMTIYFLSRSITRIKLQNII